MPRLGGTGKLVKDIRKLGSGLVRPRHLLHDLGLSRGGDLALA